VTDKDPVGCWSGQSAWGSAESSAVTEFAAGRNAGCTIVVDPSNVANLPRPGGATAPSSGPVSVLDEGAQPMVRTVLTAPVKDSARLGSQAG
jgi:hypothetical protein